MKFGTVVGHQPLCICCEVFQQDAFWRHSRFLFKGMQLIRKGCDVERLCIGRLCMSRNDNVIGRIESER
ncbi:uncharacterized protein MONOS_18222 [Monocercomonoides exilis]|uniref:uncharacterized protein n=1 Tax=Monocercomonoides exilis TaxID=2049356 RepID=UPI00355A2196|nr:hypothetical protein MONOS_18222 [Monocercomonoides exilis]